MSLPTQWISYESNSTGTISTDTSVSFQNIWMGILPATGFFNINNGTVRIAIILAIIGLVFIALYPKKNIKAPTRIFQKYKRRINSNIFSIFSIYGIHNQEKERCIHSIRMHLSFSLSLRDKSSNRHNTFSFSFLLMKFSFQFSSPFSIQCSSHFLIMFRIFVPGKQKKPKRKLYRTSKKQKIGMKQIIKHKIKTSIIRNQKQKFRMKILQSEEPEKNESK